MTKLHVLFSYISTNITLAGYGKTKKPLFTMDTSNCSVVRVEEAATNKTKLMYSGRLLVDETSSHVSPLV